LDLFKKEQAASIGNIEDHEIASAISPSERPEIAKILEKSETGCNIFEVSVTLHESCMLKSARSTVVMRNLSELGEILETIPPVKDPMSLS
jgi:hypothetical protein